MKTLVKYLFISMVTMGIGSVLGWQAFSYYKIKRHFVSFDWEQEPINIGNNETLFPVFEFNFTLGENTYKLWGRERKIEENFDSLLGKFAKISTSKSIVASFNSNTTLHQIMDIDAQIRKHGFHNIYLLIEDTRNNQAKKGERFFSELRIKPSGILYDKQIEWLIEEEQEKKEEQQ